MTTTEPLTAPIESPTLRELLEDVLPVVGVVFVAGPPVVFVAAPWLLLALMLAGPFALVVAFVAVVLAAIAAVAALAAITVAPVVLVRHLHRRYRFAGPVAAGRMSFGLRKARSLAWTSRRTTSARPLTGVTTASRRG